MGTFGLKFISDEDLIKHVAETVNQYRFHIDLKAFNKNIIDPIKLTFDSKIYGKTYPEIIESECIRQIDKTNGNYIGYFHQNIFKYFGEGWEVPSAGYDIINDEKHIYVELKNKHNTMNSASSQKTYMKMQQKILKDDKAICILAEVIAKKSQNITWSISLDGENISNKRIRRVSIDKFYELVSGDKNSFRNLCEVLPSVLDYVISDLKRTGIVNTVFNELKSVSPNILRSLFLLSFEKYEGFATFLEGDISE